MHDTNSPTQNSGATSLSRCPKCGKEWPENYCPECGQTINKPAPKPALPPPFSPPAAPAKSRRNQKASVWIIVGLAILFALSGAVYGGHKFYYEHSFPSGYRNRPASGWGKRPGKSEFSAANDQLQTFNGVKAFGNSPAAITLAAQFSLALKGVRAEHFTGADYPELFESTQGEFLTYCELHDQECVFIVHVPGLRRFEKKSFEKEDARKQLAEAAWILAQKILKANNAGQPKMELAVGLRGISMYGPIMLGNYDENMSEPEDGMIKYFDDAGMQNYLWAFFAPPSSKK
jgi:hypothetical protein